jgi:hypothetical protein
LKKNYDEFVKIIERESKKEVPLPLNDSGSSESVSLLKDLFKGSMHNEMNKLQ